MADFLPEPLVGIIEEGEDDLPPLYGFVKPGKSIGRMKAFHGHFGGGFVRSFTYIAMHGPDGLKDISQYPVLNANYLQARLRGTYKVPYDRICMHEFVAEGQFEGKVEHIVILGHALCGGLRALYEGDDSPLSDYDFLFNWVKIAQPAKDAILSNMPKDAPVEHIRRAIEQGSVINTVANLMTFDWLVERVKAGTLSVHGWYFDMTKAQLFAFNPQSCVFDKVDIGDVPESAVSALDCTPETVRQRLSKFADIAKAGF